MPATKASSPPSKSGINDVPKSINTGWPCRPVFFFALSLFQVPAPKRPKKRDLDRRFDLGRYFDLNYKII
ncbi:hypothetical protein TH15_04620 [Thalassospira profundimaris]|uniref:Uncharacterized protein n=1 Tax=Thalassospira indica TaxID=1891279 RepID=A0ABM6XUA8_9PROT|nr:hypothetical protein DY252_01475 [Thalassospira indica]OAZ15078.1 hypothetical protein TH15_04620 [Thalassospira profundimaris]